MRKLNYKLMGLAALAFAFTACDETGLGGAGEVEAALGQMYVNAESTASQMFKNVDEAMRTFDFAASPSVPLSIDGATFDRDPMDPNKYVLDYGNGVATRGMTIAGQLEVSLTNGTDYLVSGTKATIGLVNYTENDKPVQGTFSVENLGNDQFQMDIVGFRIEDDTPADQGGPKALVLNTVKTVSWTAGTNTPNDVSDDAYTLAGDGDATTPDATAIYDTDYDLSITFLQPMKLDNTCSYRLLEGELQLNISTDLTPNPLTFNKAIIDFLSGDGDNNNGCNNVFEIDLENTETESKLSTSRTFNGF